MHIYLKKYLLFFLLTSTMSCIRPTLESDLLDLEVGKAEVGGLHLEIQEGLAAIHNVSEGTVKLWASSPSLNITIKTQDLLTSKWTFEILNGMPNSTFTGITNTNDSLVINKIDSFYPTHSLWEVELKANMEATLLFGPSGSSSIETFKFAVFADVQTAIDQVEDIYLHMNKNPDLHFASFSGDLTNQGSEEELVHFQDKLKTLNIPLYATPGNHELGNIGNLRNGVGWHNIFGRNNTHFIYKQVAFSLINSSGATIDPVVYDWLQTWLDQEINKVHFFFTHFAPIEPAGFRSGSFRSRKEAGKLLVKLAKGKVDGTFYGHVHSFYSFSNAGIPAYIIGGGGALQERFDGIERHYLVVEVNGNLGIKSVEVAHID